MIRQLLYLSQFALFYSLMFQRLFDDSLAYWLACRNPHAALQAAIQQGLCISFAAVDRDPGAEAVSILFQ